MLFSSLTGIATRIWGNILMKGKQVAGNAWTCQDLEAVLPASTLACCKKLRSRRGLLGLKCCITTEVWLTFLHSLPRFGKHILFFPLYLTDKNLILQQENYERAKKAAEARPERVAVRNKSLLDQFLEDDVDAEKDFEEDEVAKGGSDVKTRNASWARRLSSLVSPTNAMQR